MRVEAMNDKVVYKKQNRLKEIWRRLRKNRPAVAGLVIISIFVLLAIFADVIADYQDEVIKQNISERLQKPSGEHWFGTDAYGRDIFARIVHGTRYSLSLGVVTTFFAALFGSVIGSAAGFYGGRIDNIIMRIMDTIMCIPPILLSLSVVAALGAGLVNLFIAVLFASVPPFVRLVRSVVLGIREEDFVEAARASGTRDVVIIVKHIMPNAFGPILVQSTMYVAGMIILTAGLSFLGLGIQPPSPEWGAMLSEGRQYIRHAPYIVFFPGLTIVFASLALNLLGDGLRDALDPKLKN